MTTRVLEWLEEGGEAGFEESPVSEAADKAERVTALERLCFWLLHVAESCERYAVCGLWCALVADAEVGVGDVGPTTT